jgi:hypothetical protein
MKVNFTDTPDSLFTPAPSGDYVMVVEDVQEKETKADAKTYANAPALNWRLSIKDGEYEGKKAFWFTLTGPGDNTEPNAATECLVSLKQLLAATGKYDMDGDIDFDPDDVIGSEVLATLTIKGDQQNIRKLAPVDEATALLP